MKFWGLLRKTERPILLIVALCVIETVTSVIDLLYGPWGRLHWEELFNARAGVQFACGHLESAWELQYRTFCGGCTVEGLMAMPLYDLLGPTVLAWKVVPLSFHLGIIFMGTVVVWYALPECYRHARPIAAIVWLGLMMATPGFYRDLGLMGWGNHAESTVFPFFAFLILMFTSGFRGVLTRLFVGLLVGVCLGFGAWFCHTSLHAAPAIALIVLLRSRWSAFGMLGGVPLGAMPWWTYHQTRPSAVAFSQSWWGQFDFAGGEALWDWLLGGSLRDGLWAERDYGEPGILPTIWWFLLWGLALWACWLALQWLRNSEHPWKQIESGVLFPMIALLGLILAYWVRYDLWENLPDPYESDTFNLRYRAPLVPMLSLLAAVAVAWPKKRSRQNVVIWLSIGLVIFGLSQRIRTWDGFRQSVPDLRVYAHDGWPDKTVPVGEPYKPLRRNQGRVQDIDAAVAFLDSHTDPLTDCRLDHVFELGRRLGLAASTTQGEGWETRLSSAINAVDGFDQEWFLGEGVAKGWISQGRSSLATSDRFLDLLAQTRPGLDETVGRSLGRNAWRDIEEQRMNEQSFSLDPRIDAGVCEGRAIAAVAELTDNGLLPIPVTLPEDWALAQASGCFREASYWNGLGTGWAHFMGCGQTSLRLLDELGSHERLLSGFTEGCRRYREP